MKITVITPTWNSVKKRWCNEHEKNKKIYTILSIFIFLCWTPFLLAFFPGIYGYDAQTHIIQFFSGEFTTHHPLLYTILFGGLYKISDILGNHAGRVIYSVLQMMILSGSMAIAIIYLKDIKCPKYMIGLVLAYYALCPLNGLMSLITTKDTIFAALVVLVYIDLCKNQQQTKLKNVRSIVLMVLGCLFRNNAVYALALFGVWILMFQRKKNMKWLKKIGISIMVYLLINVGLKVGLQAKATTTAEMWSVPLQQMARVAVETQDEELTEKITGIIPKYEMYTSYLADPIKNQRASFDGDCWKVYVQCVLKHPIVCVKAFADNIEGMWNLKNDPYAENREFIIPLTYHNGVPFGAVGFEGKDYALLMGLREKCVELFSYTGIFRHKIIALAFRQSFYFWLLIINAIWVSIRSKIHGNHKDTSQDNFANVYIFCYLFTLMLAPCAATRYFYAIMVCIPIMLVRNFGKLQF